MQRTGWVIGLDPQHIAANPETQRRWRPCGYCQLPLASRSASEHWASLQSAFHTDSF